MSPPDPASTGQALQGREARVPAGPWDVIVVGAGIYGLPTAFFLARHGRARPGALPFRLIVNVRVG